MCACSRVARVLAGGPTPAVPGDGTSYRTAFVGGKIDRIRHGVVSTAGTIDYPLSVEVSGHYLYVGTAGAVNYETGEVLAPGTVQRLVR